MTRNEILQELYDLLDDVPQVSNLADYLNLSEEDRGKLSIANLVRDLAERIEAKQKEAK